MTSSGEQIALLCNKLTYLFKITAPLDSQLTTISISNYCQRTDYAKQKEMSVEVPWNPRVEFLVRG